MIKKAQKKFIAITLSILFTVTAILFAVLFNIFRADLMRETDAVLKLAETEFFPTRTLPKTFNKVAVIQVVSDAEENYVVVFNESVFTENEIKAVFDSAVKYRLPRGNYKSCYYLKVQKGSELLIFLADMSQESSRFYSEITRTLILFGVMFIILSAIVVLSSKRVFEPIKTVMQKEKQFISDASHELKTPVSIISANADAIKTQGENQFADSIKKQVERLNFLVSDLLTLAKLDEDSQKTYSEKFSLSGETLSGVLTFEALAFECGKTLSCDIPENLDHYGDKQGYKQILNILLDNAIKYSAAGGTIKVTLEKRNSGAALTVYNDGSEIKKEQSELIFERFYRGDSSRSRESGGSGLGLSIAKSIAVKNKWTISAEPVYGKSMTITLVI